MKDERGDGAVGLTINSQPSTSQNTGLQRGFRAYTSHPFPVMKSFAPLFSAALLGLSLVASAADSDPGYSEGGRSFEGGPRRQWYGGRDFDLPTVGASGLIPLYYRPTMRYYGNGYTVSYRYIPVYRQDSIYSGAVGGSGNFRTEAFHIATDQIPSWGANSPRLTVKDASSAAPRTAVTSIIRKKPSGKASTKSAPAVVPVSDTPAPAPDSVPAPVKP